MLNNLGRYFCPCFTPRQNNKPQTKQSQVIEIKIQANSEHTSPAPSQLKIIAYSPVDPFEMKPDSPKYDLYKKDPLVKGESLTLPSEHLSCGIPQSLQLNDPIYKLVVTKTYGKTALKKFNEGHKQLYEHFLCHALNNFRGILVGCLDLTEPTHPDRELFQHLLTFVPQLEDFQKFWNDSCKEYTAEREIFDRSIQKVQQRISELLNEKDWKTVDGSIREIFEISKDTYDESLQCIHNIMNYGVSR